MALVEAFPIARRPALSEGLERHLFDEDQAVHAQFATEVWSGRVSRDGLVAPIPRSGLLLFGPASLVLPETAVPGELVVLASGVPAAGGAPALELWVDGDHVRTVMIGPEERAYDLGALPPHAHVELRYRNDLVDADGHDRNLAIHWIDCDDPPPAPHP